MVHPIHIPSLEVGDDLKPCIPTFVHWLAQEGEAVIAGQPICEIEVDKVTIEIESPVEGVLKHCFVEDEMEIEQGALVGVVAAEEETVPADLQAQAPESKPRSPHAPVPSLIKAERPDIASGPAQPLNAMRATLARRMTESKLSAPHFYLTTVIDMSYCADLRKRLKKQKVRATYNDMLIKAAGLTLREFPRVASLFTQDGYVPRDNMNVGFAVATDPEGLVVPVIRDADKKPLAQISAETKELIKKAKDKKLTPKDYAGGVFSVSNLGGFDVDQFTAIVNPGEAAILAIGKIVDTPVVEKGEIVIRPLMKVILSSDHRVIDGILAAKWNGYFKRLLQDPDQLV